MGLGIHLVDEPVHRLRDHREPLAKPVAVEAAGHRVELVLADAHDARDVRDLAVVERAIHAGDELVGRVLDVLVVLAVLVAGVVPVVQERDHQRVLEPDELGVRAAPPGRLQGRAHRGRRSECRWRRRRCRPAPRARARRRIVTSPATRSTVPVARASISSMSDRSIVLIGTNPSVHASRSARRSGRHGPPIGHPVLELDRVEDRRDVLPVELVGEIALDRLGHEIRRELDHPRPRVLGTLLVHAHPLAIDRLEEGREERADRSRTDDVDRPIRPRARRAPLAHHGRTIARRAIWAGEWPPAGRPAGRR